MATINDLEKEKFWLVDWEVFIKAVPSTDTAFSADNISIEDLEKDKFNEDWNLRIFTTY